MKTQQGEERTHTRQPTGITRTIHHAPGARGHTPYTMGRKAEGGHTPKAVTYHEQPHHCRFMIGHSLGRMESSILSIMIGHSLGRMAYIFFWVRGGIFLVWPGIQRACGRHFLRVRVHVHVTFRFVEGTVPVAHHLGVSRRAVADIEAHTCSMQRDGCG